MQDKIKGVSLMEILVALFILAIGLLAVMKMQVNAMLAANNAYLTTVAVMRLKSYENLVKLAPDNLVKLSGQWQQENKRLLPEAKTQISGQSVQLSWRESVLKQRQSLKISLKKSAKISYNKYK